VFGQILSQKINIGGDGEKININMHFTSQMRFLLCKRLAASWCPDPLSGLHQWTNEGLPSPRPLVYGVQKIPEIKLSVAKLSLPYTFT